MVSQRWSFAIVAVAFAVVAALVASPGPEHATLRNGLVVVVFLQAMLLIASAAERSGLLTLIAQHAARVAHRPSALLLAWRDAARRAGEPVPMRSYLVIGVP